MSWGANAHAGRSLDVARRRYRGSAAESFFNQLGALGFGERIMGFAGNLLLSVLPLIILMSSFVSHRIDVDITRHIGLDQRGARIVSQLFQSSHQHPVAATAIGLIVAAVGSLGVAGGLQSLFERVFHVPHRQKGKTLREVVMLLVVLGALVAESTIYNALRHVDGHTVISGTIAFLGTVAFFWWAMHFLLAGRVRWRDLFPSAAGIAVLWVFLEIFAAVYFASTVVSDSRTYGTIGVVFSLMTWFIAVGAVIVLGTALGATWRERREH